MTRSVCMLLFLFLAKTAQSFYPYPVPSRLRRQSARCVVIDPSFSLFHDVSTASAALGVVAVATSKRRVLSRVFTSGSFLCLFLSSYIFDKTNSVRFDFNDDNFSIRKTDGSSVGEHPLFSGTYEWNIQDDIVNFGLFPHENSLFLYFKETKTPLDRRIEAPIVIDNTPGQVHMFPIIGEVSQIRAAFLSRGCQELPPETTIMIQRDPALFLSGLSIL